MPDQCRYCGEKLNSKGKHRWYYTEYDCGRGMGKIND